MTTTVVDVIGPEVAWAVFVTPPASTSACMVTAVAEHVSVAFGARPPAGMDGQVTLASLLSDTATTVAAGIVVLPVFLTA